MTIDELLNAAHSLDFTQSNGMITVSVMRGLSLFPGFTGTIEKYKLTAEAQIN